MSDSPCFQLYANDFLGSPKVMMMSTAEVGAYFLLMLLDWQEGGFEYNELRLAKWCRMKLKVFRAAWDGILKECFDERDGRFWNPRLERERTKQAEWREKSHKGGVSSGQARAKGGSTTVQPLLNRPVDEWLNTPFPSPFPAPLTTKNPSPPAKTDQSESLPISWPAEGAAHWSENVGPIEIGRYGKAMKPMVDKYGWPDTLNAQKAYVELSEGRVMKVEFLVGDAVRMVRLGKQGLVDPVTTAFTERGRLVEQQIKRSM